MSLSGHGVEGASPEGARRRAPRLTDTDWLVLKGMRAAIAGYAAGLVKPGARVLDFGCGARPYAALFADLGADYRGADLGDAAEVAITPEGLLQAPDASAEAVVSFQVLEHVRDLDRYFAEARRVVTDDGWMILSTHGTWLYHPHPEDHRRWTRVGLAAEIEAHGFEVVDCTPVVGPLAWTTLLRLTCFAFALRKAPVIGRLVAAAVVAVTNLRAWVEDWITPAWVTHDNACVYVMSCRPKAREIAR